MRLLFSICFFVASSLCMAQMGDCYKPVKLAHKKNSGKIYFNKSTNSGLGYITLSANYISNIEGLLHYAYDIKLFNNFYLESGIGLNYYNISEYSINDAPSNYSLFFDGNVLGIIALLSPKWYFTQQIREGNGKSTTANAGEFIGIKTAVVYSPIFNWSESIYYFGPTIGIRRTFFSHLITEASFSALYTNRNIIDSKFSGLYSSTLHPEVSIRLGYFFDR